MRAAELGRDRLILAAKGDRSLVNLHQAGERLTLGIDHRSAELLEQQPSHLVAAHPELPPQLPGGDAVLMRRHEPPGQEPELERQVAAVQDRPGGHRGLPAASRALDQPRAAIQLPALVVPTPGAAEPLRPALLEQPASAGRVIGKLRRELRQRARPLNHLHLPSQLAPPQSMAMPASTG